MPRPFSLVRSAPPEPTSTARPSEPPRLSRRAFLGLLAGGSVAVVTGVGAAGAYGFEVERISASLPGLRRPVDVAWLADFHYGPFIHAGSVAAWVDATMALAPDVIVLGGDMVDHLAPNDVTPLLLQIARLRAPLGVYAVWGNQDYSRYGFSGEIRRFEAELAAAGVTVLVNRGVSLRDDLFLGGVDADRVGPMRMRSAFEGRPAGSASILAAHKPKMLLRVPPDVDLTLCGHTHGGQIVLPGIGPVFDRSELGREFVSGWVRAPGLGYVSRGLGVAHVPFRLNCPGEITLAILTPV